MSFGRELISERDCLQEFPELGRVVPEYRNDNLREIAFGRIGSYTELITTESFVRLRAFGIQREEFQSCKSGHSEVSSYLNYAVHNVKPKLDALRFWWPWQPEEL